MRNFCVAYRKSEAEGKRFESLNPLACPIKCINPERDPSDIQRVSCFQAASLPQYSRRFRLAYAYLHTWEVVSELHYQGSGGYAWRVLLYGTISVVDSAGVVSLGRGFLTLVPGVHRSETRRASMCMFCARAYGNIFCDCTCYGIPSQALSRKDFPKA